MRIHWSPSKHMPNTLFAILTLSVTVSFGAELASSDTRRHKHLFLDSHDIQSMENLELVLHTPRRHPDNPILVGSRPWEKWTAYVNGRPVLYDSASGEFKMWYLSSLMEPSAFAGIQYKACYAVSRDGVHWHRPNLGQVHWPGSPNNNILQWGENWMRRVNVIMNPNESDAQSRYLMTYVDVFDGITAITKGHSSDGIRWKLNADGKPWFRKHHNANLMGWDPSIRNYVMYVRMPGPSQNIIGRSISKNFIEWSEPEVVLAPKPSEPRKHFKGLAAFQYEGLYVGWLWVFQRGAKEWLRADAELATSRDGIHWRRPFPGQYFLSRGAPDSWDDQLAIPVAPVIRDRKIMIYYWGENMPYGRANLERMQRGWIQDGRRIQRATGLATLRVDGFVSVHAGAEKSGTVVIRALEPVAGNLMINAEARGDIRVTVHRLDGETIEGFNLRDSGAIQGDSLRHRVVWRNSSKFTELVGRPVQLRFHLQDADLYSFWFE